jgi:predicted dehydrogenase
MKKARIAILGCGGMGGAHAHRLRGNPEAEIVSLCDVSEERVHGFIDRVLKDYQPQPAVYADAAKMYAESKPDGVIIVTPHTQHFDQAMQALDAGVNVLMEKPMVTDSDQAHKLAEAVKKSGLIFAVGYNTPCTPEFAYLREIIRSGEMGKLETVTGWLAQNWRQLTHGSWRQDPALSGGGQMYDSGAHMFNSLVWTVEQPIDAVAAFVDNVGTPVDINGTVNIRFANGTLATVTIAGNCPGDGAGMYFTFTEGRVNIDGWGGSWIEVYRRGVGRVKYPQIEGTPQSATENFVDALLGKAEPKTSPYYGVLQSQLMDAIYESARTGQIVHLNGK